MKEFAEFLKTVRERRKLTQQDLAAKAGIHTTSIAHFEGARRLPSFSNIIAIAKALHVTTDSLLFCTDALNGSAFTNEEKLTMQERSHIQGIIDMMIQKRSQRERP